MSYLHHEMDRGSAKAGVKRIRIHDLRHSHISFLLSKGIQPVAIAKRVGHETIYINLWYAHMLPSEQADMANQLDEEMAQNEKEGERNVS